jgi:alkaline phosphatase
MRSFTAKSEHAGRRKDGRDLLSEWKNLHPTGELVTSRDQMMNISDTCEKVLGIFSKSHMQFNTDRNETVEPSLAEMTLKALEILQRNNSNGFLLVVEGAKIDLAHHYNNAYRALDDTLALDEAIETAVKNVGKILFLKIWNKRVNKMFHFLHRPAQYISHCHR